ASKKIADDELTAVRSALAEAKVLDGSAKDPVAGLKKLVAEKQAASATLAEAQTLLKPGKYLSEADPNVAQGIEKLLAEQKATAAKLKEETTQLQTATSTLAAVANKLTLAPGADQAELLKSLD